MTLKLTVNISNEKKEVFQGLLSLPDFAKGMKSSKNGQEKKKEIEKKNYSQKD